ncbi:cation:proton antiporter [Microbacterium sp. BK668]|uniref:cation:proton antiporter n=1 Tax=Microbacterium sp. BK668 TaxID=2512118 RepID=UPI00105B6124|nr:cation:proton antiporter [Microbacterium sp. BK668]TDN90647.1 transporter (CPA2 family) [Microbacterium sp. BK668]
MSTQQTTIFLIFVLAVLAPLVARFLGRWVRVPIVVFELLLGILVGPALLGWAQPSDFVDLLSNFGLAMLFFMAGSEIELSALQGRTGRRAAGGWLVSLAAGIAAGWLIAPGEAAVVVGVALCSTALGALLPILRDEGELRTPFGRSISAIGAVGEFGPLIAISLFLGGRDPGIATIVLLLFVAVAAVAIWWAFRVPQGALHRLVSASLHTSGQFAVRFVAFALAVLVALSIVLDLDMLLGAFTAGVVWRLAMRDATEHDRHAVESKVEAVAFGFLVPIFFIYTGITFDLQALLDEPVLFLLLPVGLLMLLLIRGLPSTLAAPVGASRRDRMAVALYGATGLPIIVAVTAIGVDEKLISSGLASALVGAGMLSVLLYPLLGTIVRRERLTAPATFQDDLA